MILFFLVLVYCPKGYEILAAENETCRECPRGFYKDNSNVFSSCTACPSGNTTEGSKSTSIKSCSISKLGFKCFSACRKRNQRNIAFVMVFWLEYYALIVVVLSDKNFYFKWLLAGLIKALDLSKSFTTFALKERKITLQGKIILK